MFTIILAMGLWFLYDGFVAYPAANQKYDELSKELNAMEKDPRAEEAKKLSVTIQLKSMSHHDDFSILLQKILGFTLPPIGIGLLVYWIRKSRGEIRLENGVLTLPGSPAVPLAAIDELDKELWERKGIATVYYTLDNGVTGKFLLDDFIYQAHPVRAIVKAIEDEIQFQDELLAKAEQDRLEQEKLSRERQEQEEAKRLAADRPAEQGRY
ncbi:MAG TPA: hypothetical protein VHS06_08010 [Chloroflexota bacterium]|nr:hypothetical protein [Chloroflexota bacterium]